MKIFPAPLVKLLPALYPRAVFVPCVELKSAAFPTATFLFPDAFE